MGLVRTSQIPRILKRHADLRQDLRAARVIGPHGANHVLVVLDEQCSLEAIIPNSSASTYSPGASVLVGTAGGGRARAVLSKPPSGGGTAVPLPSDTTVTPITNLPPLITAVYYAIVPDPADTAVARVHGYGIDGSYQGEITAITFATFLSTDETLVASTPIKDIPGVPDGFATIGETGGDDLILAIVNLDTQAVTEVTLADATGDVFAGTLHVDPAGPYIYAGGILDGGTVEHKLYRATLPSLSPLIEVGALADPGGSSSHLGAGIVTPDRWRIGREAENNWTGVDHIFLDPDAAPQTGTTGDTIHDGSVADIFPLGHDDDATGWFAFSDGGDVRIWKIGETGDGVDGGFVDGEYEDDGFQVIVSGAVADRRWTFFNVLGDGQSSGVPRVATVEFEGVGFTPLPVPVELDIAAAEADQGWLPGEGTPVALLPWFD